MEAAYYDNIMEQQRLEPEFFRVGFYGRKFPFFLRVSGPSPLTLTLPPCHHAVDLDSSQSRPWLRGGIARCIVGNIGRVLRK